MHLEKRGDRMKEDVRCVKYREWPATWASRQLHSMALCWLLAAGRLRHGIDAALLGDGRQGYLRCSRHINGTRRWRGPSEGGVGAAGGVCLPTSASSSPVPTLPISHSLIAFVFRVFLNFAALAELSIKHIFDSYKQPIFGLPSN